MQTDRNPLHRLPRECPSTLWMQQALPWPAAGREDSRAARWPSARLWLASNCFLLEKYRVKTVWAHYAACWAGQAAICPRGRPGGRHSSLWPAVPCLSVWSICQTRGQDVSQLWALAASRAGMAWAAKGWTGGSLWAAGQHRPRLQPGCPHRGSASSLLSGVPWGLQPGVGCVPTASVSTWPPGACGWLPNMSHAGVHLP